MEELFEWVVLDDVQKMVWYYLLLYCLYCGVGLQYWWKDGMNCSGVWVVEGQVVYVDGIVIGERLEVCIVSYWLGGVVVVYQFWELLIECYFQVLWMFVIIGEEWLLKMMYNVDGVINYVLMVVCFVSDLNEMQECVEVWFVGVVLVGVCFLFGEVDVQVNWFVVLVLGFGIGEFGQLECWVVDFFILCIFKWEDGLGGFLLLDLLKYLEDWECLVEKVICWCYLLDDVIGCSMLVYVVGIDWGGKLGILVCVLEFW